MADIESYPIPRSALLFMAAVEEAKRTNEGPIRAIAPLFAIALESQRGQLLNVATAVASLKTILGDAFTEHAFEAFIPQLATLGWLVEERAGHNRSAYRVPLELLNIDQVEAEEASSVKLKRLYSGFNDYLSIHAPLLNISITFDQFQWQMFRWTTSLDGLEKAEVAAEAEKVLRGAKASIRFATMDEPERFSKVDKSLNVEFAAFTKWLARNNRSELQDIASLTELGLAIEFLEEVQKPTGSKFQKFDTVFVLDSPVLLDVLGLSGPQRQESIIKLISILKKHGGRFATLQHCLEELSETLNTILDRSPTQRFGLTGDAIRENPALIRKVQAVARQPDQYVKADGIELLQFDRRDIRYKSYFEDSLIDEFRNKASWHDQYKTAQRDRDAMSIGYIMRRRQGKVSSEIFDTSFILVARNSMFTRFSGRFIKESLSQPQFAVGPVIETKTLAAITWMRYGSDVDPNLPQVHLISACDRILATNGTLLRKAEKRLKEIQEGKASEALMLSHQAVLDLVVATAGSADVLDGANSEELLRALTSSAEAKGRDDERRKSDEAAALLKTELEEQAEKARELHQHATKLASEKALAEAAHRKVQESLLETEMAAQLRMSQRATAIISSSARQAWLLTITIWVLLVLGSLWGQFLIWQGPDWWRKSLSSFLTGLVVMTSTGLAAAFGMRFIPPGNIDLAAMLHSKIANILVNQKVNAAQLVEDKNDLLDEIERQL